MESWRSAVHIDETTIPEVGAILGYTDYNSLGPEQT
jgi:hypothetical protein